MVAITIATILSAFSWSFYSHLKQQNENELLQHALWQALQLAQQESKIKHTPIAVCQSRDLVHCTAQDGGQLIVFINAEQDGVLSHSSYLLHKILLPVKLGRLFWRSYPFYRHFILFLPYGKSQSDNGTFWYCKRHATLPAFAIVLSQSGQATPINPDRHGEIKDSHGRVLRC